MALSCICLKFPACKTENVVYIKDYICPVCNITIFKGGNDGQISKRIQNRTESSEIFAARVRLATGITIFRIAGPPGKAM
jgi:hypothetical protein